MATKYPLLEPLLACTEEEINAEFEYLDIWDAALDTPITLDLFCEVTPRLSGGEAKVIFESWEAARQRNDCPDSTR